MNKKYLVAGLAGLAVLVFATGAKAADDYSDLPEPDDGEAKPAPVPVPNPKPAPSGKHPPNLSGDPAGYNTELFPDPMSVRAVLVNLGYADKDTYTNVPLKKKAFVKSFQKDYNRVSGANPGANMGTLVIDGTAGKNTLNAIEVALFATMADNKAWKSIVKDS